MVEDPLYYYIKIESPMHLHFVASKSILTSAKESMVGYDGDHYASTPSKVTEC